MRKTHAAVRGVSQGAAVTLFLASGGFQATLGCAKACADVLGEKHLTDYGMKGEHLPVFTIPTEEVQKSLAKLSETLSIALVDTVTDENGTRFVLLWRIGSTTKAKELEEDSSAPDRLGTPTHPDEVEELIAATASEDLDEY